MNYSELQAQIIEWLKRKDIADQVPDFIALGERLLVDGMVDPRGKIVSLRTRDMEVTKTYSPGDSDTDAATSSDPITTITLPSNYLDARYIIHGTNDLERALPQTVKQKRLVTGAPSLFYREQSVIYFGVTPDSIDDVTLNYYDDFTGNLSSGTDTNAILTAYPNLYLYAALLSAEPYLFNDKRIPVWESRLLSGLMAANDKDKKENRSGGRKTMGRMF